MREINGAQWWKFDFHTHTPASECYGGGPLQEELEKTTAQEWLFNQMKAGLDCIAVTDHNSTQWIGPLRVALAELSDAGAPGFRPLTLFPGLELTASGGVHILAIFDPATSPEKVQSLLGEVRYRGVPGGSDITAEASLTDTLEAIVRCKGLPVLAHVDIRTGAFAELTGNALDQLLRSGAVAAMEVRDAGYRPPQLYTDRKLRWARVLGSDSHHPSGSHGQRYPGSHFTWVKMGTPNLDQLRLALLDGDNLSIKRSDECSLDPNKVEQNYIESLLVSDAARMGRGDPATFAFSPWMNALIGGRGTGKSTAVHFVRACLGRTKRDELRGDDQDNLPFVTFERFMGRSGRAGQSSGVTDSTQAELVLWHEGRRFKVLWQNDGTHEVQRESGGRWERDASQDLDRFGVQVFSQGQLLEMATGDSKPLMELVDAGADTAEVKEEMANLAGRYHTLRSEVRELEQRLESRDRVVAELDDVKAKLGKMEESNHATILKDHQRRGRQKRELESQRSAADECAEAVDGLADSMQLSDLPEGMFGEDDAGVVDAVNELSSVVDEVAHKLCDAAASITAAIAVFSQKTLDGAFGETCSKAKEAYEKLVEELQQQGVHDPSDYGRLVQERQRLEEALKQYDEFTEKKAELENKASSVLHERKAVRRRLTSRRETCLSEQVAKDPHVKIDLEPFGPSGGKSSLNELARLFGWESQEFLKELWSEEDEQESGALADLYGGSTSEVEERLESLKRKLMEGPGPAEQDFGGRLRNSIRKQLESRPALVDELELWFPEDTLAVQYSQKGDGTDFKPIQSGSPGQQSAALLAFVLKRGTNPIILDQPEDDLDNQLIYDLVVEQLRRSKQSRQFIVVTHNPNIVVNGDAEQVHVMEFEHGQCRIRRFGPLQDSDIRDDVCEIMEGGRQAFLNRYRRLERGGSDV